MSTTEENYLDNLLKAVTEPNGAATMDGEQADNIMEEAKAIEEPANNIEDKLGASFGMPDIDITDVMTDNDPVIEETEAIEEPVIEEAEAVEEPVPEETVETVEEPVMEEAEAVEEPVPEEAVETVEEPVMEETEADDLLSELIGEEPVIKDTQTSIDEFSISDIDNSLDELKLEDVELADVNLEESTDELKTEEKISDIPEAAVDIQQETDKLTEEEKEEFDSLDLDELQSEVDNLMQEDSQTLDSDIEDVPSADDISDVLDLLDAQDDPDLAEINDMLKKADSNEPIADDDMMELLNQMADEEGDKEGSVTEPVNSEEETQKQPDIEKASEESELNTTEQKKKVKKAKAEKNAKPVKTETKDSEKETVTDKKPNIMSRFAHMLFDEWQPEPTEEELAKEAQEKAAAKAEADAKKAEDKKEKEEAKKAKAAEKEAANKAKAEAAAQKKKEKQEAKAAKLAEKKAKEEAEKPKNQKRLSPKKIAVVTVFATSVLAGILLFSGYASKESSLIRARRAYYAGDYKSVYVETYGVKLAESDSLVQERSKVILTMQRKLDSYENNLKLGKNVEALNALIMGLKTYDYINEEAESCGVLQEVNSIKDNILTIMNTNYGLSEQEARQLLQTEDQVVYTKALNQIINGKESDLITKDM